MNPKGSAMDSQMLRRLIRAKLSDGRLASNPIPHVWGGVGAGETCDACEEIITPADFVFGGGSAAEGSPEIQMHVTCFKIWEVERVVSGKAPDCMTVIDKIREKIASGKLPTHAARKRWAARGHGKICDACDLPITDLQFELDGVDGRVFRFHHPCMIAWDEMRGERD